MTSRLRAGAAAGGSSAAAVPGPPARAGVRCGRRPLVGALVVPEPMLAPVGENDEGGFQVLGVAAGLLLGVVGVEVLPLRFQHAQHPTQAVLEQVVRPAARGVELECDLCGSSRSQPLNSSALSIRMREKASFVFMGNEQTSQRPRPLHTGGDSGLTH